MDKRSTKTRHIIVINFLKMLECEKIDTLSVTDLCQRCEIHRKTFYSHFKQLEDIINEIFTHLTDKLMDLYQGVISGNINDFHELFIKINEYILSNMEIYDLLVKSTFQTTFVSMLNDFFSNKILKNTNSFKQCSMNKYSLYFILSGVTELYVYWLKNHDSIDIETISSVCEQLCNRSLIITKKE